MIGFLVLAAFFAHDMVPLRSLSLCRNLAFFAYGLRLGLSQAVRLRPRTVFLDDQHCSGAIAVSAR